MVDPDSTALLATLHVVGVPASGGRLCRAPCILPLPLGLVWLPPLAAATTESAPVPPVTELIVRFQVAENASDLCQTEGLPASAPAGRYQWSPWC